MIVPGSIYEGKDDIYVAIYTFYDDMYRTPPLSIQDDSLHAAHVKYKTGGVSRGIDVFLTDIHPKTDLSVRRTIRKGIDGRKRNRVDREYDINYEINGDLFYSNEMLDLIREDIKNFCGNKIAKHPEGTKIQYFNSCLQSKCRSV